MMVVFFKTFCDTRTEVIYVQLAQMWPIYHAFHQSFHTKQTPDVGLIWDRRYRRRANVKPAGFYRIAFAGSPGASDSESYL